MQIAYEEINMKISAQGPRQRILALHSKYNDI